MSDAKTYNFKGSMSNLRQITAGKGTFATAVMAREGKRDVRMKITDKALAGAQASGLDLAGPVDAFGVFESKPFTNTAGEQKVAQTFVVLHLGAVKSREEINALRAAKKSRVRVNKWG